jgi:hypothetical protein
LAIGVITVLVGLAETPTAIRLRSDGELPLRRITN